MCNKIWTECFLRIYKHHTGLEIINNWVPLLYFGIFSEIFTYLYSANKYTYPKNKQYCFLKYAHYFVKVSLAQCVKAATNQSYLIYVIHSAVQCHVSSIVLLFSLCPYKKIIGN